MCHVVIKRASPLQLMLWMVWDHLLPGFRRLIATAPNKEEGEGRTNRSVYYDDVESSAVLKVERDCDTVRACMD